MCHPSQDFKSVQGEQRECSPTLCQHQPQQPTVGPQYSLPDPEPNWPYSKWNKRKDDQRSVDGQETTALIDLGAQVSSVSSQFCEELALQIQPLGHFLELEGTRGAAIPKLGFVEVNLKILGITNYKDDVLLLVIPTTT